MQSEIGLEILVFTFTNLVLSLAEMNDSVTHKKREILLLKLSLQVVPNFNEEMLSIYTNKTEDFEASLSSSLMELKRSRFYRKQLMEVSRFSLFQINVLLGQSKEMVVEYTCFTLRLPPRALAELIKRPLLKTFVFN